MTGKHLPIAVTMGEPAGISAEITVKAWRELRISGPLFFAIDVPARFNEFDVPVETIASPKEASLVFNRALPILPIAETMRVSLGVPSPGTASHVVTSIARASEFALNGEACAIVTNPIQKSVLTETGFSFPGHTEFLADIAAKHTGRVIEPVMMLAGPELRTVPVTVHQSVSEAAKTLSSEVIVRKARIVHEALRTRFALTTPRLAISGLNPHAGENGTMGTEESDTIAPAISQLQSEGIHAFGPLPADTLFHDEARNTYDVALCMLHDQALIPVKTLDFDRTVNITLGLPFVRTSPDHGTALDLAGTGRARPDSLIAALKLAASLSDGR
ncbi:MAG: 4-hydroxythreonine-4-phosphate dehydrogenase PdxA [Pseudomonadota bacterium]